MPDDFLTLKTRADLDALYHNCVKESANLEYKASPAVSNEDPRKTEIARTAAALANASGGQIIYGMREENHLPVGLDDGVNPDKYNGLWFEQVIQQNVRPAIERLHILEIPLGNGNNAVIVTVPAAQTRAPHQLSKDSKYYRRRNFRNDVMEDYEIREAMRRVIRPSLYLSFFLEGGLSQPVDFSIDSEQSLPFKLFLHIGNRSDEPALYTLVKIYIDSEIVIKSRDQFAHIGLIADTNGNKLNHVSRNLATPHFMPIFNGANFRVTDDALLLALPRQHKSKSLSYPLWYELLTPGFSTHVKGEIRLANDVLTIRMPDQPKAIPLVEEI